MQAQVQSIDLTRPEVSVYDLSDGFSSQCFEKTFQDPSGLLWLKSCAYVGREYNNHFTTFDGHTPSIPKLTGDKFLNGTVVQAIDMNADGIIYGICTNENQHTNGLFFLDTRHRRVDIVESSAIGGDTDLSVIACQIDGEELVTLLADENNIAIKRVDFKGKLIRDVVSKTDAFSGNMGADFERKPFNWEFVYASYINHYQGKYWLMAGGLPFMKYDEAQGTWHNIGEAELGESLLDYVDSVQNPPFLIPRVGGDFDFVLPNTKSGALHYDYQTDSFSEQPNLLSLVRNQSVTEIGIERSTKTETSTVVRKYREQLVDFYNFLYHADGSIDSLIIPDQVFRVYHCFESALSGNFIFSTDAGLFIVRNEGNKPAKAYMRNFPMRGLMPIDESKMLMSMSAYGLHISVLDMELDSIMYYVFSPAYANHSVGKFVKRTDGKIWTTGSHSTALIDLESNTITKLKNNSHVFEQFDLLNDSTFLILKNGKLYAWNPERDSSELLYVHPEITDRQGYLHELKIHSNGDIYGAFGSGLLRISKDFTTHAFFDSNEGSEDLTIFSITEDNSGRLWLGTYAHGIQIFDPKSDSFETVQISDGLLSNTIATIEDDGKGYMWAGTFNGISCIDINTLEVMTTLTESDGLADNESNRFSSTKFPDGRIAIGSINGISVIDPSFIHGQPAQQTLPQIYLSAAYWKNDQSEETSTSDNIQAATIILPAEDRNLRLDLAITNYLQPRLHKFTYKIGNGPWQFAGSNHTIYFNSLKHGSYDIQLKGIDHLGNETSNVLKVPVRVLPFFYQQWWFYLICALPFVFFGIAWMRRQKKINQKLIEEVELATAKLRQDKILIESQTQQLQELDKVKSRFFTNISHEFRTPLSVILGMISSIDNHDDKPVKQAVKMVKRNTNILLNLSNQILDLVKLEAGELNVHFVQSDIIGFVNKVCDGIRPLAESKEISLIFDTEVEQLSMDFDQEKMIRIVTNLLSNAIKYTPSHGSIKVVISASNDRLALCVHDTGIGITADQTPHVFDRFFQVDNSTTRRGEGTGVGLNFTKELVEMLGGSITLESKINEGSNFQVLLPIKNEAKQVSLDGLEISSGFVDTSDLFDSMEDESEGDTDNLPALLIIEDNADIGKLLTTVLSDSYQLETAVNGQIGIDLAIERVPDIILSDVMMPVKDGVQVVNELKTNAITSHIPIVLLTAKADLDSKLEGLRRGADDYISKPFHVEELKLRIRNILAAKQRLQDRYERGAPITSSTHPEVALEDVFILNVQKVLEDHLDNGEFGIKDFCTELGVSRMQLHNKLKALTGLSTSNYIRSLRLNKAKELVLNSDLNVSQIGYAVGFTSHSYFGRSFSEKFGCSPSEMREKQV